MLNDSNSHKVMAGMNDIIDAMKNRRSIRAYEAKPIPREVLNTIIEAGNEAPSAMNSQPWRFVVVEDVEKKKKLLGAALPKAKAITEQVKNIDPERYEAIKKRYAEFPDPVYYSASTEKGREGEMDLIGGSWLMPR